MKTLTMLLSPRVTRIYSSSRRYLDLLVVLSLVLAASFWSLQYMQKHPHGAFYQTAFGPAVFLACQGKLIEPDPATLASGPISKFLTVQTDTFDCRDLPAQTSEKPVEGFSIQILYLLIVSGLIWSVTGVAWLSLNYLGAILVSGLAAGIYGTCRLFVPIPWAVAATIGFVTSGPNCEMMVNFRDYSKAPFLVGIIFLSGVLLRHWSNRRSALLSAAGAGLIAGLGFGFRTDLLLAVPFFFVVLGVFLVRTRFRGWLLATGCTVAFVTAFTAMAAPVLTGYRGGGTIGHVTLLGLMTPFNQPLGLKDPIYDIGDLYLDQAIFKLTQQYAAMTTPGTDLPPKIGPYDAEYTRYTRNSLLEFARQFPADIAMRATAATVRALNTDAPFRYLVADAGLLTFVAAVAMVASLEPAMGIFLAAIGIYFGGSFALQFDPRHAFYFEFVGWLAAAVVLNWILRMLWRVSGFPGWTSADVSGKALQVSSATEIRSVLRALAIIVTAVLLFLAILWTTRTYQQTHSRDLFQRYLSADRQKVDVEDVATDGMILVKPTGMVPDMNGNIVSIDETKFGNYYLVLALAAQGCDKSEFEGTIEYRNTPPFVDFSRALHISLRPDGSKSYIMIPVSNCVYECGPAHFDGIRMTPEMRRCLVGLEAVRHSRELPLPLVLRFAPGWEQGPLYQQFRKSPFVPEKVISAAPSDLLTTIDVDRLQFEPFVSTDWVETLKPAVASGTSIVMKGKPASRYAIAARSKPLHLARGALVVAEGKVGYGGASIVLVDVREGKGRARISIDDAGEFRSVLEVPQTDEYRIEIYNDMQGLLRNDVEFNKVGIVDRDKQSR